MNRLDLIINALESFSTNTASNEWGHDYRLCCGSPTDLSHTQHCRGLKALAAARELRALKPVAWQVMDENDALREFSIKDIAQDWITTELLRGSSIVYWIRPLYALDEVKHD